MTLVDWEKVARTFESEMDGDPVATIDAFDQYERLVNRYGTESSMLLASSLDVSRQRVHSWLQGAIPDPVRVTRTAHRRGWLPLTVESPAAHPLNRLAAALVGAGTLDADCSPVFHVRNSDLERGVRSALDSLEVGATVHDAEDGPANMRVSPTRDGDVLGRLLVAMGLPRQLSPGTPLTLPGYLLSVPSEFRIAWLWMYTLSTGDHGTSPIRRDESMRLDPGRTDEFRDAVVGLFRLELPDRNSVTVEETTIRLSADAVGWLIDHENEQPWTTTDQTLQHQRGTQLG